MPYNMLADGPSRPHPAPGMRRAGWRVRGSRLLGARLSSDSGWPSRSGASSSAARWRRPGSGSAPSSPSTSGAPCASPISTLRDPAEADEAVQDAFVKVFTHIASYREAWPFEVWFTRILTNGCLDRRKSRAQRERWFVAGDVSAVEDDASRYRGPAIPTPKPAARARASGAHCRRRRPSRRPPAHGCFMLCHYADCTPREVSAMTGLNESTVRVHLFRAARKLRGVLGGRP